MEIQERHFTRGCEKEIRLLRETKYKEIPVDITLHTLPLSPLVFMHLFLCFLSMSFKVFIANLHISFVTVKKYPRIGKYRTACSFCAIQFVKIFAI